MCSAQSNTTKYARIQDKMDENQEEQQAEKLLGTLYQGLTEL